MRVIRFIGEFSIDVLNFSIACFLSIVFCKGCFGKRDNRVISGEMFLCSRLVVV